MNLIASLFVRPAGLALAAGIALSVTGVTAAAAAPGPDVAFTWHTFKLTHGWKSASSAKLATGTPAWAVQDGIVYLRGAVSNANPAASEEFATLPGYARPAHDLYIQVYTSGAVAGTIVVDASGSLEALHGNATAFTSLASVSFPLASVASHKLKLINGWKSGQSMFNTGDPAYSVSDGVVYLSGSLIQATGDLNVPVRLPKAARPAHLLYRSVYAFEGQTGAVAITPTGEVEVFGPASASYTSLAGISYPVASTKWHKFTLENGWSSGATKYHSAAPSYVVINGVVFLDGTMYQASGSAATWTAIPATARTADAIEIEVDTYRISTGGIGLTKAGMVSNSTFSNSQAFTSLGATSYPVSS
jgi:hypothetical protein